MADERDEVWRDGSDPAVLAPEIRAAFAPLAGPLELQPLGDGLLHESFHARVGRAEFVLQKVSDVFSPDIHDNIDRVTQHLKARGFPSVTLVPTVGGEKFAALGDLGRWRLMPYLGGVSFKRVQSLAQARSAGDLVGRFHAAMQDFDQPLAPMGIPYRDTQHYLDHLKHALDTHRGHRLASQVLPLGEGVVAAFDELGAAVETPDCVIHGDLKLQNILFESRQQPGRDRAFALVDLDTLMRAPLWVELGDAWRSWCNAEGEDVREARFDMSIFEASVAGFVAGLGRRLGSAERRSLVTAPERVTLELCARYLTDALEEKYFGWDETRFDTRGDHNATRASGQWSVYLAATHLRAERERILFAD